MKLCLKCKKSVDESAKFCPICGESMIKQEAKEKVENLEKESKNLDKETKVLSGEAENLYKEIEGLDEEAKNLDEETESLDKEVENIDKEAEELVEKPDDLHYKSKLVSKVKYLINNREKIFSDKKNKILSMLTIIVLVFFVAIVSLGVENNKTRTYAESNASSKKMQIEELENKIAEINEMLDYKDQKIKELEAKVEEAKPWFDMKAEERKKQEEEEAKKRKEQQEKEEQERKEQERKEKEEQERKEKEGYNTGITYNQLARTPDDLKYKKVKFSGKVIQVMEGSDDMSYRLAVGGNYNSVLYLNVPSELVSNNRILEKDYITIFGTSAGTITYESSMSGNITIPAVIVEKISR